jgi:hypothetical protein
MNNDFVPKLRKILFDWVDCNRYSEKYRSESECNQIIYILDLDIPLNEKIDRIITFQIHHVDEFVLDLIKDATDIVDPYEIWPASKTGEFPKQDLKVTIRKTLTIPELIDNCGLTDEDEKNQLKTKYEKSSWMFL